MRRYLTAILCSFALFATASCGLQPATSFVPPVNPGSIQPIEGLPEGSTMRITSKNFTEQQILGKIAVIATKAAGYDVEDLTNVPGSVPVRNLMINHEADFTWEYTGTAWLSFMGEDSVIPDQQKLWTLVRDRDLQNGLTWGKPAPMNNTYAFAIRESEGEALGITKLSQLKDLPVAERTFCIEAEFNSRADGMNPLLQKYDIPRGSPQGVPDSQIGIYDTGPIYTATADGACNFGEVFTTDGRIKALDLRVLEDDLGYFPNYSVAPVFNSEKVEQEPELEKVFEQISPKLTDETLQELNLQVDIEGREPADVAADWMEREGFVTK